MMDQHQVLALTFDIGGMCGCLLGILWARGIERVAYVLLALGMGIGFHVVTRALGL